jgi:hypothetical protein
MHFPYLRSDDGRVHAVHCHYADGELVIGIFCLISFHGETVKISNETHRLLAEIPPEFRSQCERVKAFNVTLNILDHEQI